MRNAKEFFEDYDEYCWLWNPSGRDDEYDKAEYEACSDYAYEKRMDRLTED